MRTITVIVGDKDTACGFDVQEDGKSCGGLSWDEMIGQVAAITIPSDRVGNLFAMRTPEEWKEWHNHPFNKPAEDIIK